MLSLKIDTGQRGDGKFPQVVARKVSPRASEVFIRFSSREKVIEEKKKRIITSTREFIHHASKEKLLTMENGNAGVLLMTPTS
jgi:hypothetical protein